MTSPGFRTYAPLVSALLLLACGDGRPPAADLAAEEQAIRQLTTDWFAAEERRDMNASLSYLAPDAIIQAEGMPTVQGGEGIRMLYEGFFSLPYTELLMEPRTVVVSPSGDMAYDIGPWKIVTDRPSGRIEDAGKSTIIWRKLNGEWKAVVMSFSMDQPPPASED